MSDPLSENLDSGGTDTAENRARKRTLLIAAAAGSIFYVLVYVLETVFLPDLAAQPHVHQPTLSAVLSRITGVMAMFPVQFALITVFALLTIFRPHSRYATIYAFLAGSGVPYVVLHWRG